MLLGSRTSRATPTTRSQSPPPTRRRRPNGSCPGQNRRASPSLTTATSAPPATSVSWNARPSRIAIPRAEKISAVPDWARADGSSAAFISSPSTSKERIDHPPPSSSLNGRELIAAAASTPGRVWALRTTSSRNAARAEPSRYRSPESVRRAVRASCVARPRSSACRSRKLRTIRRAPLSRTTDAASSAATSTLPSRRERAPALEARPPSWSVLRTSRRAASRAGRSPAARLASRVLTRVAASTRGFTAIVAQNGGRTGMALARSTVPHRARAMPKAPPARARSRLSPRLWRRSRPGLAPRARRVAISRRRSMPRASRRFATLAQAMRSTNPAAASMRRSATRIPGGVSCSSSGVILNPQPALVSGCSAATLLASFSSSPRALSRERPGRRRAMTSRRRRARSRSPGSRRSGVQTSAVSGKAQPAGIRPTIV